MGYTTATPIQEKAIPVILTGRDLIGCASTGNLANAVAAHSAALGLESYVFIPNDLEEQKVLATGIYGTNYLQRAFVTAIGLGTADVSVTPHGTGLSDADAQAALNAIASNAIAPTASKRASALLPTPPFWLTNAAVVGVFAFAMLAPL